jgi:hypothetical protein
MALEVLAAAFHAAIVRCSCSRSRWRPWCSRPARWQTAWTAAPIESSITTCLRGLLQPSRHSPSRRTEDTETLGKTLGLTPAATREWFSSSAAKSAGIRQVHVIACVGRSTLSVTHCLEASASRNRIYTRYPRRRAGEEIGELREQRLQHVLAVVRSLRHRHEVVLASEEKMRLSSLFGGDSRDAAAANLLLTGGFQAPALASKVAHSCEASVRAHSAGPPWPAGDPLSQTPRSTTSTGTRQATAHGQQNPCSGP